MGRFSLRRIMDKQTQVVLFSSTAIALYGYDQGKRSAALPFVFPILSHATLVPIPLRSAR